MTEEQREEFDRHDEAARPLYATIGRIAEAIDNRDTDAAWAALREARREVVEYAKRLGWCYDLWADEIKAESAQARLLSAVCDAYVQVRGTHSTGIDRNALAVLPQALVGIAEWLWRYEAQCIGRDATVELHEQWEAEAEKAADAAEQSTTKMPWRTNPEED